MSPGHSTPQWNPMGSTTTINPYGILNGYNQCVIIIIIIMMQRARTLLQELCNKVKMLLIVEPRISLLRSLVMLSKLYYDEMAIFGKPVSSANQGSADAWFHHSRAYKASGSWCCVSYSGCQRWPVHGTQFDQKRWTSGDNSLGPWASREECLRPGKFGSFLARWRHSRRPRKQTMMPWQQQEWAVAVKITMARTISHCHPWCCLQGSWQGFGKDSWMAYEGSCCSYAFYQGS